jgi:hypothetical protein
LDRTNDFVRVCPRHLVAFRLCHAIVQSGLEVLPHVGQQGKVGLRFQLVQHLVYENIPLPFIERMLEEIFVYKSRYAVLPLN